ncbi:MAG: hypothetical protein HXS44_14755 [Theionarchaea archaeon]|nr:hypothetical protein [Theionarchaea archaeon]
MEINADLHAHSGYAGGVGKISLRKIDEMMSLKGIHIIGTGDCLHPGWLGYLRKNLKEDEDGLFTFEEMETKFLLQTEVILTSDVGMGRKSVHTVVLFPSLDAVEQVCRKMEKWGVKNTIGRPFMVCEDSTDVSQKLYEFRDIDNKIEIIPAHVLTPDGIYGSNRPITYLHEFFGDFSDEIRGIETGLSADPHILHHIPELEERTWISNSDAHSHHLHRMGREFTTFEIQKLKYSQIVESIRKDKVVRTAEFHPAEGRYFFTGHRGNRKGHSGSHCYFSPENVPDDHKCPICLKKLTIGVFERALTLRLNQSRMEGNLSEIIKEDKIEGGKTRKFVTMIPLAEIIARGLEIQSATSKKVLKAYKEVVALVGSECDLWFMEKDAMEEVLKGMSEKIYTAIHCVKNGEFGFSPPGFDGEYGKLLLGECTTMANVRVIYRP